LSKLKALNGFNKGLEEKPSYPVCHEEDKLSKDICGSNHTLSKDEPFFTVTFTLS
jgi:hypothetical protein